MAVLILNIHLGRIMESAGTIAQRHREEELLRVGRQMQQAIASYCQQHSGAGSRCPRRLEDLLQDPRVPFIRRHLRKLFTDPMTLTRDWGLILDAENSITGVYSKASGKPLKQAGFSDDYAHFAGKENYAEWRFEFKPDSGRGIGRRRY
jgi:hypothetical protein